MLFYYCNCCLYFVSFHSTVKFDSNIKDVVYSGGFISRRATVPRQPSLSHLTQSSTVSLLSLLLLSIVSSTLFVNTPTAAAIVLNNATDVTDGPNGGSQPTAGYHSQRSSLQQQQYAYMSPLHPSLSLKSSLGRRSQRRQTLPLPVKLKRQKRRSIFDESDFGSPTYHGSLANLSVFSAQPSPVPLRRVEVGVHNRDSFDATRQFEILDRNVENYDVFDYSDEEDPSDYDAAASANTRPVVQYPSMSLFYDHLMANPEYELLSGLSYPRTARTLFQTDKLNITWPVKKVAEVQGDLTLGGLMMVHEREDKKICGPIMPQGGIQALESMLHTIDYVNSREDILPGITLGAYILDDCDKDTYGLEQSIDFIKGSCFGFLPFFRANFIFSPLI